MAKASSEARTQSNSREQTDLNSQYRAIGISAVAAAVRFTSDGDKASGAADSATGRVIRIADLDRFS
jgi:hypothetical protein